jgi:hypothetical protein
MLDVMSIHQKAARAFTGWALRFTAPPTTLATPTRLWMSSSFQVGAFLQQ